MSKFRGGTRDLVIDFTTYVDNPRVAAGSEEEAWRAARIVASIWKYLGLQDDSGKRRMSGQDEVPWRGMKVHIIDESDYQLIGEEKWTNTRMIIEKWIQRVTSEGPLYYKELKSYQGLLNHFFGTYNIYRPFMKGIHLTLESWRPHREPEGWKQEPDGLEGDLADDNFGGEAEEALGKINGTSRKGPAS